jgi:hypothetical protein
MPAAAFVFTHAPVDESAIRQITPLGNLNPPGHTLPTNHAYFFHATPGLPVVAPASGVVQVAAHGTDDALLVGAVSGVSYNIAHIVLDPGIAAGSAIASGQRIGVTSSQSMAVDLGVMNQAVTLFFVRPDRYSQATLHAESPLKYFQEPLRSALYARVVRNGDDKDGKIDFDRAGRLAGNWFLEDVAPSDSESVASGPKQLAFVRDVQDPSLVRVSIGGSVALSGAFYVGNGAADPADVAPSSGPTTYRLYTSAARSGTGVGTLIVQMLADDRVRVEAFPGSAAAATFTNAAVIYVR